MAIRWDKLTVKSQQAMQQAQSRAAELGNPEMQPVHLLLALIEDREGVIPAVLEKIGVPTERLESDLHSIEEKLPRVAGAAAQPGLSQALNKALEQAFQRSRELQGRIRLHRAPAARHRSPEGRPGARRSGCCRRHARGHPEGAHRRARFAARYRPESRRKIPGAGKICQGSDRTRAPRQTRSGHRPRRRDSPRHPGAQPPHQKQSCAHWRTRRWQNRHRRGPGAAHCLGRCARKPARQARHLARPRLHAGGRKISRRVRRPAQGRPQRN